MVWAVWAAAASCYLYFLGEVVAKSRVKLDEFGRSVGAYFWSVANLFFVYWVASLLIELMARTAAAVFSQLLVLAAVILLNAAPEVIYQRGSRGGLETVQRSVRFLQANWIEWGIPNLLVLAAWCYVPRDPLARAGHAGHGADRGGRGRAAPPGHGLPRLTCSPRWTARATGSGCTAAAPPARSEREPTQG